MVPAVPSFTARCRVRLLSSSSAVATLAMAKLGRVTPCGGQTSCRSRRMKYDRNIVAKAIDHDPMNMQTKGQ